MKIYNKILISVLCVALIFLSSCSYASINTLMGDNDTTGYQYNEGTFSENTTAIVIENTTSIVVEQSTSVQLPEGTTATAAEQTTAIAVEQTTVKNEVTTAVVAENTTAAPLPDYSSYTAKQIVDVYAAALEKTRGFTGAVRVNHSESFTANIKDAHPGGALTELLASNIVKLVGSEGQQTLNFRNGYAVNADGETVPLLLPQRTAFSLPEQGVASAQIRASGNKTNIKIVLIPETVSMGQVPQYNSSAIGYLDTSDMEFKIITISRVDITYPGSVIEAVIRSDGYIESVKYTINMSTYAELSGMGITGYGTLEGAQTELWTINW